MYKPAKKLYADYGKTEYRTDQHRDYTMEQQERAYRNIFYAAVRAADPEREPGKPILSGALDGITGESAESQLVKSVDLQI